MTNTLPSLAIHTSVADPWPGPVYSHLFQSMDDYDPQRRANLFGGYNGVNK